ncbi:MULTISPECIES: OmpA family protein [Psychrobacter]|uniref:Outer membrane protein n=1 Tax=Psychrobacter alimentarius TaxID=261164 RepID=A0ABN4N5R1_9GAMM|nr:MULTISPECIES: OmpA family protein [Psychrobacter]AMT96319.1 Putative outer membrane protein [Psychrobacter alimentarius]QCB31282.1 OmpA family protein [Psychrobacter sp. PAMC27889]
MSNKLWATITTIAVLTSTLAACQTPLKSTALNQSIEELPITLVPDIPDSDGDGVLDDRDECPETPLNVVDKLGCSMPMDLMSLITMEYRAFFAKGSSELALEYQFELDRVAMQMKKYDIATMKIDAHISEDELDQVSNSLSRDRGLMVKNYLILKHDIEPSRLSTFDCSIRAPIAPSDTEEGKSFNRRVYGLVKEPKVNAYNDLVDLASKICVEF